MVTRQTIFFLRTNPPINAKLTNLCSEWESSRVWAAVLIRMFRVLVCGQRAISLIYVTVGIGVFMRIADRFKGRVA
jgi:hypothetical protein